VATSIAPSASTRGARHQVTQDSAGTSRCPLDHVPQGHGGCLSPGSRAAEGLLLSMKSDAGSATPPAVQQAENLGGRVLENTTGIGPPRLFAPVILASEGIASPCSPTRQLMTRVRVLRPRFSPRAASRRRGGRGCRSRPRADRQLRAAITLRQPGGRARGSGHGHRAASRVDLAARWRGARRARSRSCRPTRGKVDRRATNNRVTSASSASSPSGGERLESRALRDQRMALPGSGRARPSRRSRMRPGRRGAQRR